MRSYHALSAASLAAALGIVACSNGTTGTMSLSLSSVKPPAAVATAALAGPARSVASVTAAGDTTVIALGNDTIILRSVQLVLKHIEAKMVETSACDSSPASQDCEEFEAGPTLVSLPLGVTSTATVIAVDAPAGQYDEIEFEIHKADSSADAAFVAANPGFGGVSVMVTGTYSAAGSRSDFTYTTSLDASEEIALNPPVTVGAGSGLNVTLRVDVGGWFLDGTGSTLVDPASANHGGQNESLVNDNIKQSFEAFKDDNHDGHDDVNEGH